ncbi:hypothetical protein EDC01DRAFT_784960 [Geopyxis carbonaria]|nr:hypothetical protein EDC01DRAFT_784960 [Geopyxis carbonaria]
MSLYNMRLYGDPRPPSPLALTSAAVPPSLMSTTASGTSASTSRHTSTSSTSSSSTPSSRLSSAATPRHSTTTARHAGLKLSMLPPYHAAQQKLQLHQREIIHQATRAAGIPAPGPRSPRLLPRGSPGGPVTPLMLEQEREGTYFVGHESYAAASSGAGQRQLAFVQPSC